VWFKSCPRLLDDLTRVAENSKGSKMSRVSNMSKDRWEALLGLDWG
jgi:hypothetical protein